MTATDNAAAVVLHLVLGSSSTTDLERAHLAPPAGQVAGHDINVNTHREGRCLVRAFDR